MTANDLAGKLLAGLPVSRVGQVQHNFNMLIYGDSGVGKTLLAGSSDAVVAMRPVLFLDVEAGVLTLRDKYPEVMAVRVTSWSQIQSLYEELYTKNELGIKTVVIDSLTEIQKFSMYNIMSNLVRGEPERDPDVPGLREWAKNIEQTRRLVRAFRDLPVNVIFTALARTDKDNKGIVTKKPYLSGKVADEVAAFLDIVCYLGVVPLSQEEGEGFRRLLLTTSTDKLRAKDRTGLLPPILAEPTMQDVYNFLTGKVKVHEA